MSSLAHFPPSDHYWPRESCCHVFFVVFLSVHFVCIFLSCLKVLCASSMGVEEIGAVVRALWRQQVSCPLEHVYMQRSYGTECRWVQHATYLYHIMSLDGNKQQTCAMKRHKNRA